MTGLERFFVRFVTARIKEPARSRYREQIAADLHGAKDLGMSRMSVAFGAIRVVVIAINHEGATMPAPIGPLAIALRHTKAGAGRVAIMAIVLSASLLVGIGILLL